MKVEIHRLTVCANGHVQSSEPTGEMGVLVTHSCGGLTWEDGRFCAQCGGPRDPAEIVALAPPEGRGA